MKAFKKGDLVVVQTKHYGYKKGVIVEPWYSQLGIEWLVKPFDHKRSIICSPCDIKHINRSK